RSLVFFDQALQRFRARQRDIPRQNEDVARAALPENLRRLKYRVSRSELFLLNRVSGSIAEPFLHGFALMTDDDHRRLVRNLLRQVDYIIDERPACRTMEHLD